MKAEQGAQEDQPGVPPFSGGGGGARSPNTNNGSGAPEPGAEGASAGPSTRGDPTVDFNDVFSLRKPKDARAGLSSGLKSIGKGVAAGVVGLVAGPVIGAKQEGFVGFGKGLAAGVVGAVVLPVTGVTVGAVQMVRGMVNTPEAVKEAGKGKIWDEERRQWVDKPDGTIITMDDAKASAPRNARALTKPARGVDYYEVLQVPRDAPPEAIKKSYYVLARKWHPDKNPGDASAHEKFQLLGQAYQVLSNPELRERYDSHGSEGLDVNFMDGGEFFNMLFGSDLFEHLVGELAIAQAARSGGEMTHAQMKAAQGVRVDKLVVNLKALLERHVNGDEEGFKMAMQAEAQQLAAASFGDTMLHAIGRVYAQQADIHLGGIFGSLAAKMKASTENMKSQINAASAAIKVYQAHQKIEQLQRDMERKAQEAEATTTANAAAAAAAAGAAGTSGQGPAAATAAGTSGAAGQPGAAAAGAGAGAKAAGGEGDKTPEPGGAAGAGGTAEDAEAAAARKAALEQEINMARQAMEEAALPLMLEAMWAANVLDIQTTLRKVCQKLLQEQGVPAPTLKARAQALRELGSIFQAAKAPVARVPEASSEDGTGGAAGTSDKAAAAAGAEGAAGGQGSAGAGGGGGKGAGGKGAGGGSGKGDGTAGSSVGGQGPAGASSSNAGAAGGAGAAPKDAAKEARRQMEEAMFKVMEKRAGGGGS